MIESNPAEGVLTNVRGGWNVIQAAIAHSVAQFVLISTGMAVAPTNVMGTTKQVAEALLNLVSKGSAGLTAVRFGSALGSAGSVVPFFRDQIARGGPVTVTPPEVNCFSMTISGAVQLFLHSAATVPPNASASPLIFLLEMGEPVRIAFLARQMIELNGETPVVDAIWNSRG